MLGFGAWMASRSRFVMVRGASSSIGAQLM
jgi:hypothetical protein